MISLFCLYTRTIMNIQKNNAVSVILICIALIKYTDLFTCYNHYLFFKLAALIKP